MKNDSLLGPWIRRFLLEHLVAERNLSRNTQCSYRDTLWLLLPRLALRGQLSMFWRSRIYPPTLCETSSRSSKKSVAAASQLATRGCQPYTPSPTLSASAVLST
jgi:site-specific recombinase XerD